MDGTGKCKLPPAPTYHWLKQNSTYKHENKNKTYKIIHFNIIYGENYWFWNNYARPLYLFPDMWPVFNMQGFYIFCIFFSLMNLKCRKWRLLHNYRVSAGRVYEKYTYYYMIWFVRPSLYPTYWQRIGYLSKYAAWGYVIIS
jgi:hypothetical protein